MAAEEDTAKKPTTTEQNGEADTGGGKKQEHGGKPQRGRRGKYDDTPIEELFDLSKPIPRIEKPDKVSHDKRIDELNKQFEQLKKDKNKIQDKIEAAMTSGKNTEIGKAKSAMLVLRQKKGKLIDEKRVIRSELDVLKAVGDKLVKDKKDAKSGVRFGSVQEIDAEIKKLQKRQETTSMSLTEEKKLIQEINTLMSSKDTVKDLKSKDASLDGVKEQRKVINENVKAKDKEIDAVSAEMDKVGAKIKTLSEKETDKRSVLDDLFQQRETYKKDISVVLKEKDDMRDDYRENNNAWWNAQRAVKAQKQVQYEEEKKQREEEKVAFLKKQEEEELKKIPYEEEQALCDYLADYLERTYLNTGSGSSKVAAKKEDVVAVKDDPFAGMAAMSKKNDGEEYFGKGKGKKKRQRAPKKAAAAGPFTLSVDSFEQFGLIGLNPPTNSDMVEGSVKELREKKDWYKDQPRGSVPTAKDIRKQNEKSAAKLRKAAPSGGAGSSGSGTSGKFTSTGDDFVPLGKGSSSSSVDASSWGSGQKKPSMSSGTDVASEEDPTPAGAAAAAAAASKEE